MKNLIKAFFLTGSLITGAILSAQINITPPSSGGGGGSVVGGTCTNQVATAIAAATGAPTCTTVTSSYVNNSVWTGTVASGILKASAQGTVAQATSGTDYAPATSGSAVLEGNGSGGFTNLSANFPLTSIGFTVDGAGSVITTGTKGFIYIPFQGTITAVTLLSTDAAVTSGSIVIDIWKVAFASYPPTVSNTITASDIPAISSATNSQDTTLTGWTKTVNAGDVIAFHVNSVTSLLRVTLVLTVSKT